MTSVLGRIMGGCVNFIHSISKLQDADGEDGKKTVNFVDIIHTCPLYVCSFEFAFKSCIFILGAARFMYATFEAKFRTLNY